MNPQEDVRTKRIVFFTLSLAIIVVLALRFFSLQIVSGEIYKKKSIENSVKIETKLPVRGNIYDRNGKLIADNRPAFSLYLVRSRTRPGTIKKLVTTLNLDEKDIRKKLKRAGYFQPVKVARHVKRVALTEFQENILDLPGLEWKIEPKRNYYYYNKCFSHILGTLGEIDDSELGKNSEYEPGDIVGKKGIEKSLDVELRGKKGYQYIRVDAMGRSVEVVDPENSALPHPGNDLYLTIDARLQMYADTLFEGKRGALVAIDTHNGELISLLSNPSYDLNIFTSTIDEKEWKKLITDENHPLYDRACQSLYPPGSTFKMVAAIAALNERIVSPDWKVTCPGYLKIGRKTVRCWKADGHGTLDMLGAIKNSCNVYFYSLGLKIGLDVWNKYSRLFLFGQKTGIELPSEKNGLVPSEAYYKKMYGEHGITAGLIANLAIGQGELLVTPLQMAQFAMLLANKGMGYRPHLIHHLVDPLSGRERKTQVKPIHIKGIESQTFDLVRRGMFNVVSNGTGVSARIIGIDYAGKTGTAQNPHGKSHSWFICFAPYENPEIAMAVIVENGGAGSAVAAPIAGKFLRKYFYYKGEFDYDKERKILQEIWARQQKLKEEAEKEKQEESRINN